MSASGNGSLLVVSALAGDFVWRAGGAIALAAERGDHPPVFFFEPHQPEQCDFRPDVLLDISAVFDRKRKAMECLPAQQHMWDYYTDLAKRRGVQLERNAGPNLGLPHSTMAEAFVRLYPQVTGVLA
jgi:4-oxalomesaconate hydratase